MKFQYMLAPLEDITDSCFRSICVGADLTFTELTVIQALVRNNASAQKRIKLYDKTPTVIQLMGQREDALKKFLKTFKPEHNFKGFNLNIGCPSPGFIKQGMGCSMIKRVSKVKRMIDTIKDHGHEASIKMRLGQTQQEKEKKAYLNLINGVDADYFIVHARHGKETYGQKPDWTVFQECVDTGKDIIANGNISTKEHVKELKFCKGVMIGRAAIMNPLIFAQLKGLKTPPINELKKKYEKLLLERDAHPKFKRNVFRYFEKAKL